MKLFEVKESNSALKKFAKVYSINGVEGFDALTYLQYARQNMTNVLRDNRNTKVSRCKMGGLAHSHGIIKMRQNPHTFLGVKGYKMNHKKIFFLKITKKKIS